MILGKSRRHFKRYQEIAKVVARQGWGWTLERIGLAEHIGHTHGPLFSEAAPVHLREMLEELGPTFVKLGQLLSTRPDILPESYITELSKLQDTAPTLPASEIHSVIESSFDVHLCDLFRCFDDVPIAAASLAQAHYAELKDGTPVIVKVQRPNIREQVETDIEILYSRAKFLESHSEMARNYGVTDIVDEFSITIREELDYTREASNTDKLREQMPDEKGLKIPSVYWELTTSKVLTLERMNGVKITDVIAKPLPNVDNKELASRLASIFLKQVFLYGFFHADPHPGNILIGNDGEIQLLDCGQVGRLDSESKAGAVRMLMAFEHRDTRILADEILNLGIPQDEVDVRMLTNDLTKLMRAYYDLPARAVNMGQLLTKVLNVSAKHKIRLPVSFAVLGKVFTSIDGICRQLDPDFNFTSVARNYVGMAVKSELKSENNLIEIYRAIVGLRNFTLSLPENLERLMRRAIEGNLRVEFKHQGLEGVTESFTRGTNRVAIALIVGSAIVGSSLVVSTRTSKDTWLGLPAFGVLGYLVAIVFGIWLIVSIIKSGKKK